MRRARAFTLAETLVSVFLLLVVTSLVAEVLVPSLMLFRLQSARSDSQQGPMIFVHQVTRMLLNAQVETITIGTRPTAISWVDVREDDPFDSFTGAPKTTSQFSILYFDAAAGRICLKTWPPRPPVLAGYDFALAKDPLVLQPDDLRKVCQETNGTERVLIKCVRSLTIEDDAGGTGSGPLMLPLRLAVTCVSRSGARVEKEGDGEAFTLQTRLLPRCVRW